MSNYGFGIQHVQCKRNQSWERCWYPTHCELSEQLFKYAVVTEVEWHPDDSPSFVLTLDVGLSSDTRGEESD